MVVVSGSCLGVGGRKYKIGGGEGGRVTRRFFILKEFCRGSSLTTCGKGEALVHTSLCPNQHVA